MIAPILVFWVRFLGSKIVYLFECDSLRSKDRINDEAALPGNFVPIGSGDFLDETVSPQHAEETAYARAAA